jgi:hypothetical protein
MSTKTGDGKLMVAKWLSLGNHVQNIHTGHSTLFPACLHAKAKRGNHKKKWLKPGSKVAEKFVSIISAKYFQRDVAKLSSAAQTFSVEAYHSVVNHFAPKMFAFSFEGMQCRLLLAALHYNENSNRAIATSHDGRLRYCIKFPKFKKGGHTVRGVPEECTFNYVTHLMNKVEERCISNTIDDDDDIDVVKPPPMCAAFMHPAKNVAVNAHRSRFR